MVVSINATNWYGKNLAIAVKCFSFSTETTYCGGKVQPRIYHSKYAHWWIIIYAYSSADLQCTADDVRTTVMVTCSGRRVWNTNPNFFAPSTRARSSANKQWQHTHLGIPKHVTLLGSQLLKTGTIFSYTLNLANINRFSKWCHCQNHQKICNNTIIKNHITPKVCCYTTLWNVRCLKSNNWKQDLFKYTF